MWTRRWFRGLAPGLVLFAWGLASPGAGPDARRERDHAERGGATPGSMGSLLGAMPGSSGITFGMQPGRDDMILRSVGCALGAGVDHDPGGVYQGPRRQRELPRRSPPRCRNRCAWDPRATRPEEEGPPEGLTLDQAIDICPPQPRPACQVFGDSPGRGRRLDRQPGGPTPFSMPTPSSFPTAVIPFDARTARLSMT